MPDAKQAKIHREWSELEQVKVLLDNALDKRLEGSVGTPPDIEPLQAQVVELQDSIVLLERDKELLVYAIGVEESKLDGFKRSHKANSDKIILESNERVRVTHDKLIAKYKLVIDKLKADVSQLTRIIDLDTARHKKLLGFVETINSELVQLNKDKDLIRCDTELLSAQAHKRAKELDDRVAKEDIRLKNREIKLNNSEKVLATEKADFYKRTRANEIRLEKREQVLDRKVIEISSDKTEIGRQAKELDDKLYELSMLESTIGKRDNISSNRYLEVEKREADLAENWKTYTREKRKLDSLLRRDN